MEAAFRNAKTGRRAAAEGGPKPVLTRSTPHTPRETLYCF
jgi:hypothetical protein